MGTEPRTYRVSAIGSTDAIWQAKQQARAEGRKVRTVAVVHLVTSTPSAQTTAAEWDVTLAVVVPA